MRKDVQAQEIVSPIAGANRQKGTPELAIAWIRYKAAIVTSEDDPSCGVVAKARSLELAPNDSEVKGLRDDVVAVLRDTL